MNIKDLILLALTCTISSNYILVKFFNVEGILSCSRDSLKGNIFSSLYMALILILSSLLIWPLESFIVGNSASYLRLVVYTLAILLVTAVVTLISKKKSSEIFPLALSSGVLGSVLLFQSEGYTLLETVFASFGVALGYLLVTVAVSCVRDKVKEKYVPRAFRGIPIMLIALSIIALTVYCF